MGSKRKAQQFLEVSETHRHYSEIIDYVLAYFISKAEKEGDSEFAAHLKKAKAGYPQAFAGAIETTEQVYCDIFSDEELDNLIVLHSNPALMKLRGLTSEIMDRVLKGYALTVG